MENKIHIPIFMRLDRLVARYVPWNNATYSKMAGWVIDRFVKRPRGKRHLRLVVISDWDILGLSIYEGSFLKRVANEVEGYGYAADLCQLVHVCIK
jgi:hypothetical protein